MCSRRPENEDPSSATEEEENSDPSTSDGKEDASGETLVPKSKLESRKSTNQETAVKRAAKKSKTAAGSSTPGGSSARLWSDEDEVTLLKGIIEYNKSTGNSFNADLGAFYRFMEGKLGITVKKDQFTAKIRKLKGKFMDALKKSGNGEVRFSKPHELKMFKLSKKIWGGSADDVKVGEMVVVANNGKSLQKSKNPKKRHAVEPVELDDEKKKDEGEEAKEEMGEEVDFQSKYPFLSSSYSNLMLSFPSMVLSESGTSWALKRMSSIGDGKAKELDYKWKQLIMQEVELSYKKLALMKEVEFSFDS